MSDSINERRAHPRIDTAIDLRIHTDGEAGTVARMVTGNLSLGGLYCTSQVDIPEMTQLAVRLMLPPTNGSPSGGPLDAHAVVVRRREIESRSGNGQRFELALFFTRLDDDGRDRLARFLETQS